MPARDHESTSGGFTFIEVMAAVVVFSFGVVFLVQGTSVLRQRTEILERSARAEFVARSYADSLARQGYAALAAGTSMDTVAVGTEDALAVITVADEGPRLRSVAVSLSGLDDGRPYGSATDYASRPW